MWKRNYLFGFVIAIVMIVSGCGGGGNSGADSNDTNATNGSGGGGGSSGGGANGTNDTIKPVLSINGEPIIYLQKGLSYTDPGATAQDDTDGDITNSIVVGNSVNKDVVGDYVVTYSVKDSANNTATASRIVKVVYSIVKKTGQTKSYNQHGNESSGLRDDGHYQSGVSEDYHSNSDKTVVDYVTGLMWQDDQIVQRDYDAAVAYCESQTLGGHNDWRLPTIRELANITTHGTSHMPSIFESRDVSKNYWSITSFKSDGNQAWGIDFANSGTDSVMQKSGINNVRCVRGEQRIKEHLTRDDTTNIVFDPNTGLEWQDNMLPSSSNWVEAVSYCRTLSLDGSNWRLPNYNELYMLLDRTQTDALDSVFQHRVQSDKFLATSTTYDGLKTDYLEIKSSHGDDKWWNKGDLTRFMCVRTKDMDIATMALGKITDYAKTNGSTPAPTVSDYEDAGITGVTSSNLDDINDQMKNASEDETDSATEVQDIVNNTISANIPMPTLSVSLEDGYSGTLVVSLDNIDTSTLSKIHIYRNSSNDIAGKVMARNFNPPSSSISYEDTGLSGCHTYFYWVEACVNQSGTELCRIDTAPSSAKTVPDAPTGLMAYTHTIRTVYMKWNNNSDNGCTVKYHLYHRTTTNGSFTLIPEINDLTSGTDGATETNVNTGVYIHYRVQAEDANGHKSSLSCSVANGYPKYGVNGAQDSCQAAVGYTWGDQPRYPWASYNGYVDKVIFTWDDVVIDNSDSNNIIYANNYRVRYRTNGGSWSTYITISNPFTYNDAQYQMFTINSMYADTQANIEVSTHYLYDNNGDGQLEDTYSNPIYITGKTAASGGTGGANNLGIPPAATASHYYPDKIMVGWTHTDNATYYKLYAKDVTSTGTCPNDSNGLTGYSSLSSHTTALTYDHHVSWKSYCYRVKACNSSGCTQAGPSAYGNSTGN